MNKRILVTAADFQSPNRGVEALSLGLLEALIGKFPEGFELTIINSAGEPNYDDSFIIDSQKYKILKVQPTLRDLALSTFLAYLIRTLGFSWLTSFVAGNRLLRIYMKANIVIDMAEGDSFTTIYGRQRFLRHSLYKLPAIALDKSLWIFPQTIGPFESALARSVAKYILSRSKIIFTREPISTELVRNLKQKSVVEASDMAFLLKSQPVSDLLSYNFTEYIGINVSGLLWNQGIEIERRSLNWSCESYRSLMINLLRVFALELKLPIVLVPHVYVKTSYTDDVKSCHELSEMVSTSVDQDIKILERPLSAPQLKAVIGQADFFVGARMHSCIAAISSQVPTVAISYSHKFLGVFRQLDLEECVIDPKSYTISEMINQTVTIYQERDRIKLKLEEILNITLERAYLPVTYL